MVECIACVRAINFSNRFEHETFIVISILFNRIGYWSSNDIFFDGWFKPCPSERNIITINLVKGDRTTRFGDSMATDYASEN